MRLGRAAFNLASALAVTGLVALGIWQVERRTWKLDLIARVEARVSAAPTPAPGPAAWPSVTEASDAYRHVRVSGRFRHESTTLVQAVTALGGGFWVLTPLVSEGFTVLVNRGFVPSDRRDPAGWRRPEGEVVVTGLLRLTEPGGAFLRSNAPPENRWYSRDVAVIASARGLSDVAPYFIDADAGPEGGLPVGGLTVVAFHNNHLVYALTWFTLAAMMLGAAIYVNGERRR
ncbi:MULTISPECIES: SURF1 family protein [Methylobacterium]|uniref:SURF1 family protein n=1 Tax=Methylobacterium sp. WL8 TaxID=2603899 RepID=UPI0011C8EDB0|nr:MULTISPECIES: SURF1 family protein [Methylobacterium]TXN80229.1 SURF1 family protein [Methylobacterium sp. WL8]